MNLFVTVYLVMLWLRYTSAEVREKAPAHHDPRKIHTDTSNRDTLLRGSWNFQQLSKQFFFKTITKKSHGKGSSDKITKRNRESLWINARAFSLFFFFYCSCCFKCAQLKGKIMAKIKHSGGVTHLMDMQDGEGGGRRSTHINYLFGSGPVTWFGKAPC